MAAPPCSATQAWLAGTTLEASFTRHQGGSKLLHFVASEGYQAQTSECRASRRLYGFPPTRLVDVRSGGRAHAAPISHPRVGYLEGRDRLPKKTNEINGSGGGSGIRTHETLLTSTHFPGVRLRPLGHPSGPGRGLAAENRHRRPVRQPDADRRPNGPPRSSPARKNRGEPRHPAHRPGRAENGGPHSRPRLPMPAPSHHAEARNDRLVQLDAEAGRLGQHHLAVLHRRNAPDQLVAQR